VVVSLRLISDQAAPLSLHSLDTSVYKSSFDDLGGGVAPPFFCLLSPCIPDEFVALNRMAATIGIG